MYYQYFIVIIYYFSLKKKIIKVIPRKTASKYLGFQHQKKRRKNGQKIFMPSSEK